MKDNKATHEVIPNCLFKAGDEKFYTTQSTMYTQNLGKI